MSVFKFKHFQIHQQHAALKVGTDSMLLGALCNWNAPKRLLDIGTGTGVLALMCAQRFAFEEITCIELSKEACIDAQTNARHNPFSSRISIVNLPIQEYTPGEQFDAIITNPPFFENSLKNQDEQKALARHTETLSFPELIRSISRLLTEDGKAWMIIPFDSRENLIQTAKDAGLFVSDLITLFGKPGKATRVVLSLIKQPAALKESSLCIRTG
jgi:tRNA1Val (adenine37-N6)-methyltransferase